MSIYKLIPITNSSIFVPDVINLILRYKNLLFSAKENPIYDFLNSLDDGDIKIIGAIENEKLFAFVAFYNFRKISTDYFSCYMYGAAYRKNSNKIEFLFPYILKDLKKQGCRVVRFETYFYNLPMRFLAKRLGFRKVGILKCSSFLNNKWTDNILYEKIL